jgi:hypothetical protein
VLLACAVLAATASSCTAGEEAAACVAVVEIDGHPYYGHSEPDEPVPTRRARVAAVQPGCNDTGGPEEPDEAVEAQAIKGVPTETAVLHDGVVHVREGARMPATAGRWFTASSCTGSGTFRLAGRWVSVSEPAAPHFDGVLDPPYDVVLDVERGPGRYVGEALEVRVTGATSPVLARGDLDLMPGAMLRTTVRCRAGGFVAVDIGRR